MRLLLAIKAFFKAFKEPEKARQFIDGMPAASGCSKETVTADASHLRLLGVMQQSGRLVDFLKEDISAYDDAQIGAAVRKIHDDCAKCLEDLVTIRPVFEENEGAKINVPQGYDPSKIKVVGNIKGEPPFAGVLVHKGWKAHKRSLPKKVGDQLTEIIWPAEVEIR